MQNSGLVVSSALIRKNAASESSLPPAPPRPDPGHASPVHTPVQPAQSHASCGCLPPHPRRRELASSERRTSTERRGSLEDVRRPCGRRAPRPPRIFGTWGRAGRAWRPPRRRSGCGNTVAVVGQRAESAGGWRHAVYTWGGVRASVTVGLKPCLFLRSCRGIGSTRECSSSRRYECTRAGGMGETSAPCVLSRGARRRSCQRRGEVVPTGPRWCRTR